MAIKTKSYDLATQKLMRLAAEFDVVSTTHYSLPEMVYLLRETFKNKSVYKKVLGETAIGRYSPSEGFCLVSSYYIYLRTGGAAQWNLIKGPDQEHWWLEDKKTSARFDITYDQFSKPFNYDVGEPEIRIQTDEEFQSMLFNKAMLLGKIAGLE